ncbi:MAG TPA: N-acetylmuramoyl-L-alanine amidase [Candidatus Udaeobacter sp.]|jgi:N-acetylmuramoyl-L-alanine amidase|nr:N-acetylmuramoyl-L-alanine amidase [Candidatus Udaeobacter sp.]
MMRKNSFPIGLSAAGLLMTFLATSLYAAKSSRSSDDNGSAITVVIDAGHGGHDRGGIPGQRVAEKDMTLDVALRLRNILSANGYNAVMTRSTDVFVPLGGRVAIANSYRNAIFVCIHFNATPRSGASGIETYFYSRESLPLASAIHHYVAGGAPSENRGVRRRGYYVLRKTSIPSVLVECGFLTNPTEAAYAQSGSYRQKLAEEIAAGIRRRNSVGSGFGTTRVATAESIPLQPYMDQTNITSSKKSRSKKSHKRSTRKKKSSSKRSDSEASATSSNRES